MIKERSFLFFSSHSIIVFEVRVRISSVRRWGVFNERGEHESDESVDIDADVWVKERADVTVVGDKIMKLMPGAGTIEKEAIDWNRWASLLSCSLFF